VLLSLRLTNQRFPKKLSRGNPSLMERTISNKVTERLTDIMRSIKLSVTESRWFTPPQWAGSENSLCINKEGGEQSVILGIKTWQIALSGGCRQEEIPHTV